MRRMLKAPQYFHLVRRSKCLVISRPLESKLLLTNFSKTTLYHWLKSWKVKISKSTHVTFPLHHDDCPHIQFENATIPQTSEIKYKISLSTAWWMAHLGSLRQNQMKPTEHSPTPYTSLLLLCSKLNLLIFQV